MLVGLQLFPYDVADEGGELVLERSALAGANVLLPAVNYIREPQPVLPGVLPHNPVRKTHTTDGGAYFRPRAKYPPGMTPPETEEPIDAEAALLSLAAAAAARDVQVVPWVSLLNGKIADKISSASVVNAAGEPVRGWLCPNAPETKAYVLALIADTMDLLEPRALFIDRIRFPEWGPAGPIDGCACFCEHCIAAADADGIDIRAPRAMLSSLIETLTNDPAGMAGRLKRVFGSGVQAAQAFTSQRALLPWLVFRHACIERLVSNVREAAHRRGVRLWLDVWPPAYGWLLGQDLSTMSEHGDWVKPFTYHRLAGGADIAGFFYSLTSDDAARQRLYEAYKVLFGFPGPDSFEDFAEHGLHPEFITEQTRACARAIGGRAKLAAGLQLWQVGPEGVATAIEHALRAHPDGLMHFCYGWATLEELAAAGEALRRHVAGVR